MSTRADVERLLRDTIPRVSSLELRPSGTWWVVDARYGMAMTLFVIAPTLDALVAEVGRVCPEAREGLGLADGASR